MQRRLLPSLNALAAFEATARHGSVVQASLELGLSQSAVSRLVRQVEAALQVPLFDRVKQRLELTEAGCAYGQTVRTMFDQLEQSTFHVMASGTAAGSLSLGVFSTLAIKWLIPRLPRFQQSRPGVIVNCYVRAEPFDFDTDPLDAAIHYGSPVWPGATAEPLFGENLVPVASPDLPGIGRIRTASDLASFPLLHEVTRPAAWRDWFLAQGVDSLGALHGARFDQFGMVTQAAAAGLGVALVPLFLVEEEFAGGRHLIPVGRPVEGPHKYYLVYPHRKAGSRLFEEFKAWLTKQSLGGSGRAAGIEQLSGP